MALEDFAMFRTVPGAACFYPSDAVSCERAIELAANHPGITFTRTSRPATAVIYKNDETFEIGKGKVCTAATPSLNDSPKLRTLRGPWDFRSALVLVVARE